MNLSIQWLTMDGKLLLSAKTLRMFAYGFLSVILAIYLRILGYNDILIGLLLASTLLSSVLFTFIASMYADRIGRKKMLIIYSILMSISGSIFILTENYFLLILASIIGTINVTGSETGSFLSIEQAILPQTVKDTKKRNTVFALYNTAGTLAMSGGILVSGLPAILEGYGLTQIGSIKPLFALYSILAVAEMIVYFLLTKEIEIKGDLQRPMTKTLSPGSRVIVGKLSGLFAVDSFAGGFVIQSVVALWFFTKFNTDLSTLSYIFSIAGVLTAFSFMVAARLADRIGLVNTMVFTHIPSNILLIFVGLAPTLPVAIGLYLLRMALSQMDVPTRQSYIVSIVGEEERTAATGFTNISRNVAQAISPSLTGYILQSFSNLAAPFVLGGLLKIVYDIALYFNFRNIRPDEEKR